MGNAGIHACASCGVCVNARDDSTVKVGLALSSGGAAGMAHVGVLEELVAAGIPIHCVAGTSAGAMLGAVYAADRLGSFRALGSALS